MSCYFNYLKNHCLYVFRALSTKSKNRKSPEPPNNEDEDEDVKAERLKVKELMSCQCCEEVIQSVSPRLTKCVVISFSCVGINLKSTFHMNLYEKKPLL